MPNAQHEVIRLQLSTGVHFIINPTAAQFEFEETALLWPRFVEQRDPVPRKSEKLDYWQDFVFAKVAFIAGKTRFDLMTEVSSQFGKLAVLMRLPEAIRKDSVPAFTTKKQTMVVEVRKALKNRFEDFHRPRCPLKRISGYSVLPHTRDDYGFHHRKPENNSIPRPR